MQAPPQQPPPPQTNTNNVSVPEELQKVKQALAIVFSPTLTTSRATANDYLVQFQQSRVAWMVCDQLLSSNEESPQTHFFAAQTLHTKIQRDIADLQHDDPSSSLASLRDSLCQSLLLNTTANNSANYSLTKRLAMCIAALAVQMNWTSVVTELLLSQHSHHIVA